MYYDQFRIAEGAKERQEWANKHAKTHSEREHLDLRASGLLVTPEAAEKLVPYGIIPVQDIVMNEESAHAALQAARAPSDDAETTLRRSVGL